MTGSFAQRLLIRALMGTAIVALVVAPVACKKDPTSPPLVAATDVELPITAASFAAVSGESFVIPGGGEAIGPAFAGQTITMEFTTNGTSPSATITTGSGTIVADVSFGSCRFTVRSFTGTSGILTTGEVFTVSPCVLKVDAAGQVTGTTADRDATLSFGHFSSLRLRYTVTISPTGVVTIRNNKTGSFVTAGTVTIVPRTGARP